MPHVGRSPLVPLSAPCARAGPPRAEAGSARTAQDRRLPGGPRLRRRTEARRRAPGREHLRPPRRVRVPAGALRLRQDDPPLRAGGTPRAHRRLHLHRRSPGEGSRTRPAAPVPGPGAVPVAHGAPEPGLRAARAEALGARGRGAARPAVRLHSSAWTGSSDALPHQLSGGMRMRVQLARALAMDPAVLLMDEPFAALDAQTRGQMHQLLQRVWHRDRKTVVFVTHDVREALALGDRVVVMAARPGRVLQRPGRPPSPPARSGRRGAGADVAAHSRRAGSCGRDRRRATAGGGGNP